MMNKAKAPNGASSTRPEWNTINWQIAQKQVRRLQIRIAKASREGRHNKAKALQWLLTHSFTAKLLAVKQVTQNTGGKTAGIDNVIWKTDKQKILAVQKLHRRGYVAQPLRRVYIPKKNSKQKERPLGIPTMKDRAMQALHLLALEPISEIQADGNSYGFRPKRSTADAISHCFYALARRCAPAWILEGDIKACFDRIEHSWLIAHIPMDKAILRKWLTAGYVEKGKLFPTMAGTPQGGIISPTLANMTLDGLEKAAKMYATKKDKIHVIRYADDFIITGNSKELLENKIKPSIMAFLQMRGLQLSPEKTRITHIENGFDFLGAHARKYKGKLLIKPAKGNIQTFLSNIKQTIESNHGVKTEILIRKLNAKIRGWANYHRHIVSKKTFSTVDNSIFWMLYKWLKRRHPNKNAAWRYKEYFRTEAGNRWIFHAKVHKESKITFLDLFRASQVPIRRHLKIQAQATPYDPLFKDYFMQRDSKRILCMNA